MAARAPLPGRAGPGSGRLRPGARRSRPAAGFCLTQVAVGATCD